MADIASQVSDFQHIRHDHIWTSVSQCRNSAGHGVYASVLPLRFKEGAREVIRRGVRYSRVPLFNGDHEILYIVTYFLPRFCNLGFEQKMKTIFHELYHISPEFNGDIRRFPGRNYAHGVSRKKYDECLKPLIQQYLSVRGESHSILAFLHDDFESLMKERGRIVGRRACRPGIKRCNLAATPTAANRA